jgi:hypothetical protein
VEQDGSWVAVTNLALSEALVDREYFQTIELTFDEIEGQAIRVFGSAGGQRPFTSLTELEVFGANLIDGDANGDGKVDHIDLELFGQQFGGQPAAEFGCDFDGDGDVDLHDFASMRGNWGFGTVAAPLPVAATPEPASAILVLIGLGAAIRRRRKRTYGCHV